MCATFKWERGKDSENWTYDGSSAARKDPSPGNARKGFLSKGRIALLVVIAGVVGLAVLGMSIRVERVVSATGSIEPLEFEDVKAPAKGIVEELAVAEGQSVETGELLARIWPDDASVVQDVEEKKMETESARKELEKAKEGSALAQKELESSRQEQKLLEEDKAEIESAVEKVRAREIELQQKEADARRAEELFRQELISRQESEQARSSRDKAEAELKSAQADARLAESHREQRLQEMGKKAEVAIKSLEVSQIEVAQREEELARKEEQLQAARERLARLEVKSPISGRVVRLEKKKDDHVESGDFLLQIAATDELRVRIEVPSRSAHKVKVGQEVRVASRASPTWRFGYARGQVIEAWTYVRSAQHSPQVETLPAFAAVEYRPFALPLGTTVDVTIVVGERPLLVPDSRIREER